VDSPRRLLTAADVAERAGLTAEKVEAQARSLLKRHKQLEKARDDKSERHRPWETPRDGKSEWQRLWDAVGLARFPGRGRWAMVVPGPLKPQPQAPPPGQEAKILRAWNLYAESAPGKRSLDGYTRWRKLNLGAHPWLPARPTIDYAVKGQLAVRRAAEGDRHKYHPPNPEYDWRQLRADGTPEKVVTALDRRAGLS
jgi:hypothetical protein